MTKKEFITEVAKKLGKPVRTVDQFFEAFLFVLKEQLIAEEKVLLSHLGIFETKYKSGLRKLNPFTNEVIDVPQKRVVKFTPSKYLKDIVNF
ncbi:HU family DNA-binding protein [Mycoplasmopsis columbinasalis]|uniref:DNA-binding protein HU n=1 Tax=Mycoplasmopsis columbinasalis TaxID=114880 RepID=A0A449BB62_9BACT|nr:HU family DNA-binding protein [Mycoplasmopsis columbinasalis]VEU78278.1 DNA-binding protein HU [Mycoplasmopsis columbinasalis]